MHRKRKRIELDSDFEDEENVEDEGAFQDSHYNVRSAYIIFTVILSDVLDSL